MGAIDQGARAIYDDIVRELEPSRDPDPRQTVRLVRDIRDPKLRARVMDLLRQRSRDTRSKG